MIKHFLLFKAGLIREAFYAILCFITLRNKLKMSEYKVYWLTDFPLINSWVCLERIIIFLLKWFALVIKKVNKQVKGKISNFTVDRVIVGLRRIVWSFNALFGFFIFGYYFISPKLCYHGNYHVKLTSLVAPEALLDFW